MVGIIPFDLEDVFFQLDIKLREPTIISPPSVQSDSWVSKTSQDTKETSIQIERIKYRTSRH